MPKDKKNNEKIKAKKESKKNKTGFFKGLKLELSKVKWPTFKEVSKYTIATIFLVVFLGLFFEGLNLLSTFVKGLFN